MTTTNTTVASTTLPTPALCPATGMREYRLEIVTDPGTPAAPVCFRADGTAAAIVQARRLLADLDGPYGALYRHDGEAGSGPAIHLTPGLREYRLEIVTDPDPDTPAALMCFRAGGTAAAIAQARRLLAVLDGPADRYGELYQQRLGAQPDFLTTLHLGA